MKISPSIPRILVLSTLLMVFALSCGDTTRPRDVAPKTPNKGLQDFTLKSLSGQTFKLSSYRGKHVLLIFFTTWCSTCRSEIPHYKHIHETYGRKGLEVAMINILESKEAVSRFAARYHVPISILLDEKDEVSRDFGIVGVPAMVLIDKDGYEVSRQYAAMDMLLETIFGTK
jgi:peroxiredoxin